MDTVTSLDHLTTDQSLTLLAILEAFPEAWPFSNCMHGRDNMVILVYDKPGGIVFFTAQQKSENNWSYLCRDERMLQIFEMQMSVIRVQEGI